MSNQPYPNWTPPQLGKGGVLIIILVFVLIFLWSSFYVIDPGQRGVLVTLGKVHEQFSPEGVGLKMPIVTTVYPVSVRQQTKIAQAECYSADLQGVNIELRVLFRIPENQVIKVFKDYAGDPFDSLIFPRVSEAIKEVTAMQSAEQIVKKREEIKLKALTSARQKLGELLFIEDLVIQNVSLTKELERAIEQKMVQEQEAAKARFTQQKAEIEASTAIIRARGEAEAIRVRGKALQDNPGLVQLQIVEKWNGVAPTVLSTTGTHGANIILPLDMKK
ncbi:MAG: prohibitin family protein [Pseudomonadota bacterium]